MQQRSLYPGGDMPNILKQCWLIVGPASTTLDQHLTLSALGTVFRSQILMSKVGPRTERNGKNIMAVDT